MDTYMTLLGVAWVERIAADGLVHIQNQVRRCVGSGQGTQQCIGKLRRLIAVPLQKLFQTSDKNSLAIYLQLFHKLCSVFGTGMRGGIFDIFLLMFFFINPSGSGQCDRHFRSLFDRTVWQRRQFLGLATG